MITAFQKACARVGKHTFTKFSALNVAFCSKNITSGINIVNSEPVTRYITNPQGVIETVTTLLDWLWYETNYLSTDTKAIEATRSGLYKEIQDSPSPVACRSTRGR